MLYDFDDVFQIVECNAKLLGNLLEMAHCEVFVEVFQHTQGQGLQVMIVHVIHFDLDNKAFSKVPTPDADRIEAFTGTENPMPARVILLDATGRVLWFHDRGFSPVLLQELDAMIRGL